MYKLTIAVLTYNRSKYLQQMLDSILLQTYKDFSVIIYDNCSEDNTTDIVKPYLSDNRFTYHRHDSMVDNFNYALQNCDTDYLLIVHDDDTMRSNMAKEEIDILNSHSDISMVWANMDQINANNEIIRTAVSSLPMNNKYTINPREYIKLFIKNGNMINCPTVMFRMSVIRANNLYFRNNVGSSRDCFMWLELNQLNYKFYYINNVLYNYRIHENQDSTNTLNMVPLLRKPFYDLLVKNNYSRFIISSWLHYIDKEIIYIIRRQKDIKKSYEEIKNMILFNDKKDISLRLKIYLLINFPSLLNMKLLLIKKINSLIPKSIKNIIKKFITIRI